MDTSNRPKANAENSRPHTGSASGCCGGPAPAGTSACCVRDAEAKSAGDVGCGCGIGAGNADIKEINVLRVMLSPASLSAR